MFTHYSNNKWQAIKELYCIYIRKVNQYNSFIILQNYSINSHAALNCLVKYCKPNKPGPLKSRVSQHFAISLLFLEIYATLYYVRVL